MNDPEVKLRNEFLAQVGQHVATLIPSGFGQLTFVIQNGQHHTTRLEETVRPND